MDRAVFSQISNLEYSSTTVALVWDPPVKGGCISPLAQSQSSLFLTLTSCHTKRPCNLWGSVRPLPVLIHCRLLRRLPFCDAVAAPRAACMRMRCGVWHVRRSDLILIIVVNIKYHILYVKWLNRTVQCGTAADYLVSYGGCFVSHFRR